MSISSKKINKMIVEEFKSELYSDFNQNVLSRLAQDIYALEASHEGSNRNRKNIEEITDRISVRADEFYI